MKACYGAFGVYLQGRKPTRVKEVAFSAYVLCTLHIAWNPVALFKPAEFAEFARHKGGLSPSEQELLSGAPPCYRNVSIATGAMERDAVQG
jgi:hypothetical protein